MRTGSGERAGRPRRFLLEHWPFLVVLLAGLVVRILVTLAYRPALMFVGDSYGYLLRGADFAPGVVRPIFYPLMLEPFQRLGHVGLVPVAQHAVGLAIGVAIYVLLRRLGIGPWGGTLASAPILLDAYEVNIEQFIMAETVFTALVVAALLFLLWRHRPGFIAAACAGLLIAFATLTREVGIVLIVPVVVFLLVRRAGILRVASALVAFAVPLVLYLGWYHSVHGQYELSGRDGFFLYGRVATFASCSPSEIPPSERLLCDPRPLSQRPFANFYVWNSQSPFHRLLVDPVQANGILKDFSMRVIKHQPLGYAKTVLGDFLHFLAPGRTTGRQDEPLGIWQFPKHMPIQDHVYLSIPSCLAHPTGGCAQTVKLCFHGGPGCLHLSARGPSDPGIVSFLQGYQRLVFVPGPLIALGLILGLLGGLGLRGRWRLRAESLLFTVVGILVLIVPVMTVMFDYRYMLPGLALIPPGGVVGAVALQDRVARWRARRSAAGSQGAVAADREPGRSGSERELLSERP